MSLVFLKVPSKTSKTSNMLLTTIGALRKGPTCHGSREVSGRLEFRMQAVKWVVAKLQEDRTALPAGE